MVALIGATLLVVPLLAASAGFDRAVRKNYPPAAADRVAAEARARPGSTILATVRFGDWLLWRHPELAGRLLFDARYELLTSDEIERNALFRVGAGTDSALRRSSIVVLDPDTDDRAIAAIKPKTSPVFDNGHVLVAVERR